MHYNNYVNIRWLSNYSGPFACALLLLIWVPGQIYHHGIKVSIIQYTELCCVHSVKHVFKTTDYTQN